jgi:phospholipid N-methyltransferase
MQSNRPTRFGHLALFGRNFFKHPRMLGSIIPSSRFLIDQVLRKIDWQRARVIVEYGPGVGTFTHQILRKLPANGKLIVVETNEDFVDFLRASVKDPRLHVIHGSAAEIAGHLAEQEIDRTDYVISGIPFSTMPDDVRSEILRTTRSVLRADGAFLVYQFSQRVQPHLENEFSQVERKFEMRNILPAQLFFCMP